MGFGGLSPRRRLTSTLTDETASLEERALRLLQLANDAAGSDNITVALVRPVGLQDADPDDSPVTRNGESRRAR